MARIMRLLIQFPTRARPERFKKYLLQYVEYLGDRTNYHIHISCDTNDSTMYSDSILQFINGLANTTISYADNTNKIQAINAGISKTDWDILLLASDDMWPVIPGYDNIIRECFSEYFPDMDGVLHFNDGIQGNKLNTLAILGNKYYNRFGYIYNPAYKSFYADNEFDDTSRLLGKYKYMDKVIIRHMRKEVQQDAIHKLNHKYIKQDKGVYNKWRAKQNIT